MPNLDAQHPRATIYNSFALALLEDKQFANDCYRANADRVQMFQQRAHDNILAELHTLPIDPEELPLDAIISNATPINAIRAQTERLLWHQRLGHPSDY